MLKGFQRSNRILSDLFMNDADRINPAHEDANLGDGRPCKFVFLVHSLQPLLDSKRFDVLSQFIAPSGNEVVPDIVIHDGNAID